MSKNVCKLCRSQYKDIIEEMIFGGASSIQIAEVCKSLGIDINKRVIETHRKHMPLERPLQSIRPFSVLQDELQYRVIRERFIAGNLIPRDSILVLGYVIEQLLAITNEMRARMEDTHYYRLLPQYMRQIQCAVESLEKIKGNLIERQEIVFSVEGNIAEFRKAINATLNKIREYIDDEEKRKECIGELEEIWHRFLNKIEREEARGNAR